MSLALIERTPAAAFDKAGGRGAPETGVSCSERSLHVVQVSRDLSLLGAAPGDEPCERQLAYARELERLRPGSQMTILVLAGDGVAAEGWERENVRVAAVNGPLRGRWRLRRALLALHRERPVDVVATQTVDAEAWIALLFARRSGSRVVGQIHTDLFSPDYLARRLPRWLAPLRLWLTLRGLRYFHSLRVVGEGVARRIRDGRWHGRIRVIPVPSALVGGEPPRDRRPGRRAPRVLFVGRLAREKDLDTWLEVCARVAAVVPEARFDLVGSGPEEGRLRARAAELGIGERLRFHGALTQARLRALYAEASALLLTSRYEGFGRVVAEALAAGLPVVATRVTGVEDQVEHSRSGFLHDREDVEGMARSVALLLREEGLRRRLGERGRCEVRRRFEPERLRRRWVEMLVAAARPEPGPVRLPRRRTFARWREIAFSRHSVLRALEYERLRGLELRGRVLDLGGGERTSYRGLLRLDGARVESVNLDPEVRPSCRANLERPLPFADGSFDAVLSLNTFEHLERDELAIAEALRVLRPGGEFHFVVPFLYRVHASPRDFNRRTAEWWRAFLERQGVDARAFAVEPLVWDRLGTAFSFFGSGLLGRLTRPVVLLPAALRDLRFRGGERLPDRGAHRRIADYALGYYVHGVKP